MIPPREAWNGARAAREPLPGTVHGGGNGLKLKLDSAVRGVKDGAGRGLETVQRWPRNKQLAAGGAALAVVVVLGWASRGRGAKTQPSAQATSAAPVSASFETQLYNDRGINVKVPKTWKHSAAGSYVDYVDPEDNKHKVRILVEKSNGTPSSFLKVAENGLTKNFTSCPKPYHRVNLTTATIAGQEGGVLEYQCGAGTTARHGLWGAVISNGKAYSFFLTSSETQFQDSKPIFDEMVASYKLTSS